MGASRLTMWFAHVGCRYVWMYPTLDLYPGVVSQRTGNSVGVIRLDLSWHVIGAGVHDVGRFTLGAWPIVKVGACARPVFGRTGTYHLRRALSSGVVESLCYVRAVVRDILYLATFRTF